MRKDFLILLALVLAFAFAHTYMPFEFMYAQAAFLGTAAGVAMDPVVMWGGLAIAVLAAQSRRELIGVAVGLALSVGITVYVAQTYHRKIGLQVEFGDYVTTVLIRVWDIALVTAIFGLVLRAVQKKRTEGTDQ